MDNYHTVEEKSSEWGITARHVQYLCRIGRIEGAIKRAGSWFIPDNAPPPMKNTKTGSECFNFVGTKKKIFESAISLFMQNGFNDVSLRDIASSVGIRQSTIYNHFKSKQEILDTIYDYYRHYYLKNRYSIEALHEVIKSGSLADIVESLRYEFDEECREKMHDITRIIFQRVSIDERANEMGRKLIIDEGISYVEQVFNESVACGRYKPFDTHAMSVLINSIRLYTLVNWLLDPSVTNMTNVVRDEWAMYKFAERHVVEA